MLISVLAFGSRRLQATKRRQQKVGRPPVGGEALAERCAGGPKHRKARAGRVSGTCRHRRRGAMMERTASPVRKKPQRLTATAELAPKGPTGQMSTIAEDRIRAGPPRRTTHHQRQRSVRRRRVGQATKKTPMALPCLAQSGRRDMIVQWCSYSSLATRIRH